MCSTSKARDCRTSSLVDEETRLLPCQRISILILITSLSNCRSHHLSEPLRLRTTLSRYPRNQRYASFVDSGGGGENRLTLNRVTNCSPAVFAVFYRTSVGNLTVDSTVRRHLVNRRLETMRVSGTIVLLLMRSVWFAK